jgi:nicotinamidase-related amidase
MSRNLKVDRTRALLLVIDVQERLLPAMEEGAKAALLANLSRFGQAKKALELPALITEQYPKGLGPTVPEVAAAFEGVTPMAKSCFDALGDEAIARTLRELDRSTVLVAGMETHICVFQTVRSLAARGFSVHVLADAVASRTRANHELGLELSKEAGAVISSTETALFDMLERAGTDAFKLVSKLVR